MTSYRSLPIASAAVLAVLAAGSATAAAPLSSAHVELPPFRGTLQDDYYPPDARSHYLQGRSLVEFSLNDRGVPTDVSVIQSEPAREFDRSSERLVKNLRFELPASWDASAAQSHRFRIGVSYQVVQCLNFSKCEAGSRSPPAAYDGADRTYVVSAQQRVLSMGSRAASEPPPMPQTPTATPASPSPAPYRPPAPSVPGSPGGDEIYPPG